MKILPPHPKLDNYLKERNLEKKFIKQKELFEQNPFHPSLNTELLEPKSMRFWSFRVSGKYRAIFIFQNNDTVEIIDINNHYQ
ncbi:MAG: type II toxin-antitoxin system mRNA interferase toxin, RelE/StbE family [bacterium]|nr:type II toxin-antitoxin system mRNA interferase toxin, RelE/StbE family [bacterium]